MASMKYVTRPVSFLRLSALFLLGLSLFAGCSNADPEPAEGPTEEARSTDSSEMQSVAASNKNEASPAAPASLLPPKTAGPDVVCDRFMNSIEVGNRAIAEQLLTSVALALTDRAGLELEPLGGAASSYKVGDVYYATTKQKLAHVSCQIFEPGVQTINVTWTLKKQNVGWRISGVILHDESGKQDLLSFENPRDVAQMKGVDPNAAVVADSNQLAPPTHDASAAKVAKLPKQGSQAKKAEVATTEKPGTAQQASHEEPIESDDKKVETDKTKEDATSKK